MSEDEDAKVEHQLPPKDLAIEHVITKTFNHYSIPLEISEGTRRIFKAKLWRMGNALSKMRGFKRMEKIESWKDEDWKFEVDAMKVKQNEVKRKLEADIRKEQEKGRKLEQEVKTLKSANKKLTKQFISGNPTGRGPSTRVWQSYSRQQQLNKKKKLANGIQTALEFCEEQRYKACSIEVENIDTNKREILDLDTSIYRPKPTENYNSDNDRLHSIALVKDKFTISNAAYHELSVVSDLPNLNQVKSLTQSLNNEFDIKGAPNGITGVQQSLAACVEARVRNVIMKTPDIQKIRVKLTGDGTQIARGLTIVNVAFTILEEGDQASSVVGNHSVAIFKIPETYENLAAALEDICKEGKQMKSITINDKSYEIETYLGGDLKFLAMVCGIDAANCEHACIWCKCPKSERWNMSQEWSITDTAKGARTIEEITRFASMKQHKFNCSHKPLFSFIPIHRVIIDTLHLFLRISDLLINLLIRDLRTVDGISKTSNGDKYVNIYENFLNNQCKIRFHWITDKTTKSLKWRDLTGPEQIRLFKNINIPSLFPSLPHKDKIQQLWTEFYTIIQELNKKDCDSTKFEADAKGWVILFTSIYQRKDVTPYMHAFAMHIPEFLRLNHGNISIFSQQGLEKLNDVSTKHFQRSSNHRNEEALTQMLQKGNRIEILRDNGYERIKRQQKCSICNDTNHNKRTCPLQSQ